MTNAKRGRGSGRRVYLCLGAGAALGIALSGCGGGSGPTSSASQAAGQGVASSNSGTGGNPPTASSGAVTINWAPPTENTDGTPLMNLAGYDIHYGTASGDYTQTITVSNPGIATYVVDNLTPGKYYFSLTAVNSQGTESQLSSELEATVN